MRGSNWINIAQNEDAKTECWSNNTNTMRKNYNNEKAEMHACTHIYGCFFVRHGPNECKCCCCMARLPLQNCLAPNDRNCIALLCFARPYVSLNDRNRLALLWFNWFALLCFLCFKLHFFCGSIILILFIIYLLFFQKKQCFWLDCDMNSKRMGCSVQSQTQ